MIEHIEFNRLLHKTDSMIQHPVPEGSRPYPKFEDHSFPVFHNFANAGYTIAIKENAEHAAIDAIDLEQLQYAFVLRQPKEGDYFGKLSKRGYAKEVSYYRDYYSLHIVQEAIVTNPKNRRSVDLLRDFSPNNQPLVEILSTSARSHVTYPDIVRLTNSLSPTSREYIYSSILTGGHADPYNNGGNIMRLYNLPVGFGLYTFAHEQSHLNDPTFKQKLRNQKRLWNKVKQGDIPQSLFDQEDQVRVMSLEVFAAIHGIQRHMEIYERLGKPVSRDRLQVMQWFASEKLLYSMHEYKALHGHFPTDLPDFFPKGHDRIALMQQYQLGKNLVEINRNPLKYLGY